MPRSATNTGRSTSALSRSTSLTIRSRCSSSVCWSTIPEHSSQARYRRRRTCSWCWSSSTRRSATAACRTPWSAMGVPYSGRSNSCTRMRRWGSVVSRSPKTNRDQLYRKPLRDHASSRRPRLRTGRDLDSDAGGARGIRPRLQRAGPLGAPRPTGWAPQPRRSAGVGPRDGVPRGCAASRALRRAVHPPGRSPGLCPFPPLARVRRAGLGRCPDLGLGVRWRAPAGVPDRATRGICRRAAPRRQAIREVQSPRLAETRFRSPQLALFELGPDEWLLYLRLPEYAPRHGGIARGPVQLPLLLDAPGAG